MDRYGWPFGLLFVDVDQFKRINDSLASSGFAIAGKKTGHDAIVLTGRAERLSVLVIDDDRVRVEPATDLAGKTCNETEELLKQRFGADFSFAVIGPAGERLVRYATISHDGRHAGRGGSGAVLGSKNIKAVAVRGTNRCEWAFPRDDNRTYNQLPWRMIVPRGVGNLLVAGRCASMTHEGQSAARASGGCFVMGQAAGTAAASLGSGSFAAVDVPALQRKLAADGVDLDR